MTIRNFVPSDSCITMEQYKRLRLAEERAQPSAPPVIWDRRCGTTAGYQAHLRSFDPHVDPCDACKRAAALTQQRRRPNQPSRTPEARKRARERAKQKQKQQA